MQATHKQARGERSNVKVSRAAEVEDWEPLRKFRLPRTWRK